MQISWMLISLTAAVSLCAASPPPAPPTLYPLARSRRELDFFTNTGKLIEELVSRLNAAAKQAQDAVSEFNQGLGEQAQRCRERFQRDLEALQRRVADSIDRLQQKFLSSGSAIGECVNSHREAAAAIYSDAGREFMQCADGRIAEGGQLIQQLQALKERGRALAGGALADMRNCTQQGAPAGLARGVLGVGACLGGVAIRTEMQAASLLMQSGLAFGRLNLFMATIPAGLEMCAGSALVGAGMDTARLLMEIGGCSTHAIVDNFVGGGSAAAEGVSSAAGTAAAGANSVGVPAASLAPTATAPATGLATSIVSPFTNAASLAANQINNLAAFNI